MENSARAVIIIIGNVARGVSIVVIGRFQSAKIAFCNWQIPRLHPTHGNLIITART